MLWGVTMSRAHNLFMGMILYLKSMQLKKKLLISFFLIVVLSSAIIGMVSNIVFERSVMNEIGRSIQGELQQTMQNIDYKLSTIEELNFNVITSARLKEIFENPSPSYEQKRRYYMDFIENIYPGIFGGKSRYVHSVYFYGNNGVNLVSNGQNAAMQRTAEEVRQTDIYAGAQEAEGKRVWFPTHIDRFVDSIQGDKIISYACKLLTAGDFRDWGLMVINVNENTLYDSYKSSGKELGGYRFVTDDKGNIISHADKSKLIHPAEPSIVEEITGNESGSFITGLNGEEYSVHYFSSSKTGWKIISAIPMKSLYQNINLIRKTITVVIAAVLVLSIVISLLISSGITRPVKMLLEHMDRVKQGELDVAIDLKSFDEIGMLCASFNEMTQQIKILMENIREDEKMLRKSEFKALQAQINPHFMYNTLDAIYWMTKTGEYNEIAEMSTSLATFFRLGLNKGREITTVGLEVEHAKNYMLIQKLRYKERFEFRIDVDENIKQYECVKLILQPLIENALVHGFNSAKCQGVIEITGRKAEDILILDVSDNGKGFNVQNKQNVLKKPEKETSGYGLYNVNERIKLYFGNEYGLSISQSSSGGAKVEIRIPVHESGGKDNA